MTLELVQLAKDLEEASPRERVLAAAEAAEMVQEYLPTSARHLSGTFANLCRQWPASSSADELYGILGEILEGEDGTAGIFALEDACLYACWIAFHDEHRRGRRDVGSIPSDMFDGGAEWLIAGFEELVKLGHEPQQLVARVKASMQASTPTPTTQSPTD